MISSRLYSFESEISPFEMTLGSGMVTGPLNIPRMSGAAFDINSFLSGLSSNKLTLAEFNHLSDRRVAGFLGLESQRQGRGAVKTPTSDVFSCDSQE